MFDDPVFLPPGHHHGMDLGKRLGDRLSGVRQLTHTRECDKHVLLGHGNIQREKALCDAY